MKIGKDTLNAARRLFRLCMDGNTVAEDRVRLIARKIAERKPRNYVALLTAFSRMVEYAVKSRTATIQSAVPLTEEERSQIQAKLTSNMATASTTTGRWRRTCWGASASRWGTT